MFRRNREDEPEAERKKNLKDMTFPQKLEYFWMYDKWVIVLVIALIAAAVGGHNWYENYKTQTLLTTAIINGVNTDYDAVLAESEEILGISAEKYKEVTLITNYTANEETGELDYYSQMGFVTQVQSGLLDVVVMPQSVMEVQTAEYFKPMEEVLGEDLAQKYADQIQGNCLVLDDPEMIEKFGLYYDPVCIGVLVNSKNTENAAVWISGILESIE